MNAKSLISILFAGFAFLGIQAHAAVDFHLSSDAIATVEWDNWTYASSTASSTPGSQGSGTTTTAGGGFTFTSTEVTTKILQDYGSFGGLLPPAGPTAGDTYYVHDGAYEWAVNVTLSSAVDYFRVSYALPGRASTSTAATDFANTPSLSDAVAIDSGSYNYNDSFNSVYYTTFELDEASDTFAVSFGDIVAFGFYPGSFKSVDGIYVEAFSATPSAVPEPQAFALLSGLIALICIATRRRVRS